MVSVVQLVERQIVVLVVVGSSPTVHPAKRVSLRIDSFFVYAPEKFMTGFQNMFQEYSLYLRDNHEQVITK